MLSVKIIVCSSCSRSQKGHMTENVKLLGSTEVNLVNGLDLQNTLINRAFV